MSEINLRPSRSNVEFQANVIDKETDKGQMSRIFSATVPPRSVYILKNNTPVIAKLRDENGDEIEADATLVLAGGFPGKSLDKEIDDFTYRNFKDMTISEQSDENRQGRIKVTMNEREKIFDPDTEIVFQLESDTYIDPDESVIMLAVEEQNV